jgi:hypothetical protein
MVLVRDQVDGVHLLRSQGRGMSAPLVGLEQDLIGQDVQLLLNLALDVLRPEAAEDTTQLTLVDGVADRLAGSCNHLNEETELGG